MTYAISNDYLHSAMSITVAIFLVAFFLGIGCGNVFGWERVGSYCAGTFMAVLILWAPIVVVTYGFALLAAPLLICLVGVGVAGLNIGGRIKKRCCLRD